MLNSRISQGKRVLPEPSTLSLLVSFMTTTVSFEENSFLGTKIRERHAGDTLESVRDLFFELIGL